MIDPLLLRTFCIIERGRPVPCNSKGRAKAAITEQLFLLMLSETIQSFHKDLTSAACVTHFVQIVENYTCRL